MGIVASVAYGFHPIFHQPSLRVASLTSFQNIPGEELWASRHQQGHLKAFAIIKPGKTHHAARDISCCIPLKTNNIPPENQLEDDPASFWKWFPHSVKNGCISKMGDILTVACFIHWENNASFPRTTATLSRQTIIHRGT